MLFQSNKKKKKKGPNAFAFFDLKIKYKIVEKNKNHGGREIYTHFAYVVTWAWVYAGSIGYIQQPLTFGWLKSVCVGHPN